MQIKETWDLAVFEDSLQILSLYKPYLTAV